MLREAAMQGLSGPSRKLSEFRGKPLIINVWASWCGPCRSEMGSLERLFWRYEGRKFAMIGISTDDYRDKAEGLPAKCRRAASATSSTTAWSWKTCWAPTGFR